MAEKKTAEIVEKVKNLVANPTGARQAADVIGKHCDEVNRYQSGDHSGVGALFDKIANKLPSGPELKSAMRESRVNSQEVGEAVLSSYSAFSPPPTPVLTAINKCSER